MSEFDYVKGRFNKDLSAMGISMSTGLALKSYSKSQWGNYNPNNDTITIYIFAEKECITLINYEELFKTLLHEYVHSVEWNAKNWTRLKGVMHDPLFFRIYNHLIDVAEKVGVLNAG